MTLVRDRSRLRKPATRSPAPTQVICALRRRGGDRRVAVRVAVGDARDDAGRRRRHADLRNLRPRHPVQRHPDERRASRPARASRSTTRPSIRISSPRTHAVFGEFMFGAVLVQRLLAALAIVKLVEIAIGFTHRARVDGGAADRHRLHRLEVLAHRRAAVERIALRAAAGRRRGGDDSACAMIRRRRRALDRRAQRPRDDHAIDGAAGVGVGVAGGVAGHERPAAARTARSRSWSRRSSPCSRWSRIRNWIVAGVFAPMSTEARHHAARRQRAAAGPDDRSRRARRSINGSASATTRPP